MTESLTDLLESMRGAQRTAIDRQAEVTSAVNDTLAGGIGAVAGVADALDALRTPSSATPAQTSSGASVPRSGAFRQALANLAQAQLDATNRSAHIASAVNAGVIAGTEGVEVVANGLRRLAETPDAEAIKPPAEQQAANDFPQRLLEVIKELRDDDPRAHATSPGDVPAAAVHVCPTCQGTGRIYG